MIKSNFDVISVTSSLLQHQRVTSQDFFYFGPLSIKISGYASESTTVRLSGLHLMSSESKEFPLVRTGQTPLLLDCVPPPH